MTRRGCCAPNAKRNGAVRDEILTIVDMSSQLEELRRGVHSAGTTAPNGLKVGVRVGGSGTSMAFKQRGNRTRG